MASLIQWSTKELVYLVRKQALPAVVPKAAANVAVLEARVQMNRVTELLRVGKMDVGPWYDLMTANQKNLYISNFALARGGFGNLQPQDLKWIEGRLLQQIDGVPGKFPGLRAFAEDIADGRYGGAAPLKPAVLTRASAYAESGRCVYENARVLVHQEGGYQFATRYAAKIEHCPTCEAEDGVKRPIDEVVQIGDSECNVNCHCIIEFSYD